MAETKAGKKYVVVEPFTRANGTKVGKHIRSTPRPSRGAAAPRKAQRPGTNRHSGR
jgi:hypothetical protein